MCEHPLPVITALKMLLMPNCPYLSSIKQQQHLQKGETAGWTDAVFADLDRCPRTGSQSRRRTHCSQKPRIPTSPTCQTLRCSERTLQIAQSQQLMRNFLANVQCISAL